MTGKFCMAGRLIVLEWLYKADQDFQFTKISLSDPKMQYFDQICFFLQQAAEKYLKAYIVKFDLQFVKQHDLSKLLKICLKHDKELAVLAESCQYLSPFYYETRYADTPFSTSTSDQADKAYQEVEKIQLLIREKLNIGHEVTLEEIKRENDKVDVELKKAS